MEALRSSRGGGQGALAIVAVISIIVAGYFILKQTKSKSDTQFEYGFYYCTNCKKEFVDSSKKYPPIKCPYCKQMTAVAERKYKCTKCGKTFAGWLEKWDMESKRNIERRKQGENVPDGTIGSILVSPPGEEDWMDSSTQEAIEFMNSVTCPDPNCGGTGMDLEQVIPKPEK